jgi:hypothetical protein
MPHQQYGHIYRDKILHYQRGVIMPVEKKIKPKENQIAGDGVKSSDQYKAQFFRKMPEPNAFYKAV